MSGNEQDIFRRLLERYPELEACGAEICASGGILKKAALEGNKILVCGNGGSAADADHITGELLKSFCKKRPIDKELADNLKKLDCNAGPDIAAKLQGGIPAIALSCHTALSTAFGNDVDPNLAFAQQCHVFGKEADVFWGISTSGNAENVYRAALVAKAKGLKLIGMTGKGGGKLKAICDSCICVPRLETYEVQELHLPVYHALCLYIEESVW
ncbi:MAG: SIS domain-containing protein [Treponema sp.]|jgi:D-sedoheptulose 7-phosphate isomerase|nr:SIS domain-containing protein [Treponema sp.]